MLAMVECSWRILGIHFTYFQHFFGSEVFKGLFFIFKITRQKDIILLKQGQRQANIIEE